MSKIVVVIYFIPCRESQSKALKLVYFRYVCYGKEAYKSFGGDISENLKPVILLTKANLEVSMN